MFTSNFSVFVMTLISYGVLRYHRLSSFTKCSQKVSFAKLQTMTAVNMINKRQNWNNVSSFFLWSILSYYRLVLVSHNSVKSMMVLLNLRKTETGFCIFDPTTSRNELYSQHIACILSKIVLNRQIFFQFIWDNLGTQAR